MIVDKEYIWQQFYPTYNFSERDIVLKEYETCARNLESQERIFSGAINILLVVATIASTLTLGVAEIPNRNPIALLPGIVRVFIVAAIILISYMTMVYFGERQKSMVIDSRKIVVLRRMLGLDYGSQQLILPNWRIEGATNPFAIPVFSGWFRQAAYPFWIILVVSLFLLFELLPSIQSSETNGLYIFSFWIGNEIIKYVVFLLWILCCTCSYRKILFDTNEKFILLFARIIARILRIDIFRETEYLLYRGRLASHEMKRLKIDGEILIRLKKILIFIEDRRFKQHKGIDYRGIVRAIWDLRRRRITGGSTITQQLVRSLFIPSNQPIFRRKIVEILLAKWIEKVISKDEIIELYLASVRFDNNVYGIVQALKNFWQANVEIDKARSFFLIERISNIKSRVLVKRIDNITISMKESGLLTESDIKQIKGLYREEVQKKRLEPYTLIDWNNWLVKQPA